MRSLKNWVDTSYKLPGVTENPWLVVDFQSLGRVDIEVNELWRSRQELISPPHSSAEQLFNIQESMKLQRTFDYSRLWVLAAYELVRVVKNLDREKYRELYNLFRVVRIPMAKYEKAQDKSRALNFAHPALGAIDGEIGWEYSPNQFMTRNQLADELLRTVYGHN